MGWDGRADGVAALSPEVTGRGGRCGGAGGDHPREGHRVPGRPPVESPPCSILQRSVGRPVGLSDGSNLGCFSGLESSLTVQWRLSLSSPSLSLPLLQSNNASIDD